MASYSGNDGALNLSSADNVDGFSASQSDPIPLGHSSGLEEDLIQALIETEDIQDQLNQTQEDNALLESENAELLTEVHKLAKEKESAIEETFAVAQPIVADLKGQVRALQQKLKFFMEWGWAILQF